MISIQSIFVKANNLYFLGEKFIYDYPQKKNYFKIESIINKKHIQNDISIGKYIIQKYSRKSQNENFINKKIYDLLKNNLEKINVIFNKSIIIRYLKKFNSVYINNNKEELFINKPWSIFLKKNLMFDNNHYYFFKKFQSKFKLDNYNDIYKDYIELLYKLFTKEIIFFTISKFNNN